MCFSIFDLIDGLSHQIYLQSPNRECALATKRTHYHTLIPHVDVSLEEAFLHFLHGFLISYCELLSYNCFWGVFYLGLCRTFHKGYFFRPNVEKVLLKCHYYLFFK